MFSGYKSKRLLKKINALELVPVTKHGHRIDENGNVVLLIPKFKSEKFARWFIPRRKSLFFSIKLDKLGSLVYLMIDGKKDISTICKNIQQKEENENLENMEERTVSFISNLYKYRYITFEQLISQDTVKIY